MENYGTVNFEGKEITVTSQPNPAYRSDYVDTDHWYNADGKDADGNSYTIWWYCSKNENGEFMCEICDDDECFCDWDNPSDVIKL